MSAAWLDGWLRKKGYEGARALIKLIPFGVPRPVGPSYPTSAVQRYESQLPLLPLVTSNRKPGFEYRNCAVCPVWPVRAKVAATMGDDRTYIARRIEILTPENPIAIESNAMIAWKALTLMGPRPNSA